MFKILKQEFLFIPIMVVIMEVLRHVLFNFYPETALFDKGSELETFLFRLWQLTWVTSGVWLAMRIVFPSVYRGMKSFYVEFASFTKEKQHDLSIKIFFCFFFGLILLMSGRANNETGLRKKLVDTLNTQLHVREVTGHNDGVEVEKYLSFVNRYAGDAWCAAFVSWNLDAVGVSTPPNPKTAWSPSFSDPIYTIWSPKLLKQHKAKTPKPGDCFTLYYSSLNRVGHVGFIIAYQNGYFITIEGNTGLTGSREGSGVHKYKRPANKIYTITNYITPYLNHYENQIKSNCVLFDYNNNQLLSSALNKIYRKNIGENGNHCFRKGFDSLQRYDYSCSFRQFEYRSNCFSGQERRNYVARNSHGNSTLEKLCIHSKREIIGKMPVQRIRNKGTASGKIYPKIDTTKVCCSNNHRKNQRGSLRTSMG